MRRRHAHGGDEVVAFGPMLVSRQYFDPHAGDATLPLIRR